MSLRRAVLSAAVFALLLLATAVLASATFPLDAATAFTNPAAVLSAAEGEPMRVGGAVQRPRKIAGDDPIFPASAKQANAKGTAKIDLVISAEGKVVQATIAQSAGREDFDQAALDAIETWTFRPGTLRGKPVSVRYTITVGFES